MPRQIVPLTKDEIRQVVKVGYETRDAPRPVGVDTHPAILAQCRLERAAFLDDWQQETLAKIYLRCLDEYTTIEEAVTDLDRLINQGDDRRWCCECRALRRLSGRCEHMRYR